MDTGLLGRVALITGASRNIGREVALALAREGASVALCTSRSLDALEETADLVQRAGGHVMSGRCDVTLREDVHAFVGNVVEEFGQVDVLVNNAVHRVQEDFYDISTEQWQRNLDVNLSGPFNMCQEVLPHMVRSKWGRIVNFSGIRAFTGGGSLPKTTVKLGIVGFSRALASEFGRYGVTVNCVAPGTISVERDAGLEREADKRGHVHESVPISRFGRPEEVASLVVYLSSEGAGYITGQCYGVSGGGHLY